MEIASLIDNFSKVTHLCTYEKMELHLHLSVAFRALDRKWGAPVDLDTSADGAPCLPAVIERPSTTFSSEEYLETIKKSRHSRPKPYTRDDHWRRKENVKRCDSFSDISVSRIPSESDFGGSVTTLGSSSAYSDCFTDLKEVDHKDCSQYIGASIETFDPVLLKKRRNGHVFKQLKNSALSFVEKRRWKKLHL